MDRPQYIEACLSSIMDQKIQAEIIVIDQSKGKETEELIRKYNDIKYLKSNKTNLSYSRNLGILEAKGEVLAFIDDDARADKDWLNVIENEFSNERLDMLAGKVFLIKDGNKTVQFQNGIVSDYGYIEDVHPEDEIKYLAGNGHWYSRPMGTNMAFKRSALLSIGGFDEFYEYIHDETDVAIRLIRSGGIAKYSCKMIVDHYQAPSRNRKEKKYDINWYTDAKNNVYFGMKNGSNNMIIRTLRTIHRITSANGALGIQIGLLLKGEINLFDYLKYILRAIRGILKGLFFGLFIPRHLLKIK